MSNDPISASDGSEDALSESEHGAERRKAERRRHGRYPLTASVEAIESSSKIKISGRTSDIGLGGCYVDTMCPLPVGANVKLCLTRDGSTFETRARVANASVGMGMGLIFTATDPLHLKVLEQWLAELSGQSPSEVGLPGPNSESHEEQSNNDAHGLVLGELVIELMRTGILSEAKGRAILQKLSSSALILHKTVA